jgi:cytochrome c553
MATPARPASTWTHCVLLSLALLLGAAGSTAGPRTVESFDEAMSLRPDAARGARLYRSDCAGCHGPAALGDPRSITPALAGQVESYLLKQLVDFVELDRTAPQMHRLMARQHLAQPQAWRDLTAFLSALPAHAKPETGPGARLGEGARLFEDNCAACHGESGEGQPEGMMPALRGQHYSYLLLQLRSFDADHRTNVEMPFLEYMAFLSRQDLEAVADFISRLPASRKRE